MAFDLGGLLQQYLGGNTPSPAQAEAHYDQAARAAPPDVLSSALSGMFRSDQTPPFGQMAGQMYGNSNPNQRAGMLNSLITGMGPTVLASLAGQLGSGGLGGMLGQLMHGGGGGNTVPTITPDQASQITPEQVQVIADHAEQNNPSVVDRVSDFYAQHPDVVKAAGGVALAVALSKLAQHGQG